NPGTKEIRMRQQVGSHESSVAVTSDSHPIAIGNSHLHCFIYRGLRACYDLLDICVVHGLRTPYHRHGRVIKNSISMEDEKQVRDSVDRRKTVGGACKLARRPGHGK